MKRSHTRFEFIENRRMRSVSVSLLTLATVFGIVVICGSRADASCGDYLAHHRMVTVDPPRMPGSDRPTGDNPHRTPCDGPFCHRGPMQFPPTTPVVLIELHDRWGWMATFTMPMPDKTSYLAQVSERVSLPMIAFRLDRPPKA